jgi:hypothetical protein
MSSEVAHQKQNYFQPIHSETEKTDLFAEVALLRQPIQIKSKTAAETETLTNLVSNRWEKKILLAHFESGAPVSPGDITLIFDLNNYKYFAKARLTAVNGAEYSIVIGELFKLQRRNAFRVDLPKNMINAKFKIRRINQTSVALNFRVINLSAEGAAIEVPADSMRLLDKDSKVSGILAIGTHEPIELQARIRYGQKYTLVDASVMFHTGCRFEGLTLAQSQKLAFIVNDCHRLIFSRLHK